MAADATHLTGSDPTGQALRRMLTHVHGSRQIDVVHAHATGTEAHDPIELAAIEATCAADLRPSVYSHKGALGHSLGASGLVGVVLNCKMHREGIVPPNVRTTQPLACARVQISSRSQPRRVRRSIVLAAGFGGAMAAVCLAS
jgi:3-oxoacyl-[acyl-carrier-protein] synthase II